LRAIVGMVADADTFADEVFGFHAQQSVEKALKGWITLLGREFPRAHDLEQLFRTLTEAGLAAGRISAPDRSGGLRGTVPVRVLR
jgi:hypothetical protein